MEIGEVQKTAIKVYYPSWNKSVPERETATNIKIRNDIAATETITRMKKLNLGPVL